MRDAVGDPSLAYLRAVLESLRASQLVVTLTGGRIYSQPPAGAELTFPWIRIESVQTNDAGADCQDDAVEAFIDLHVWSRAPGPDEAANIASAIKKALHKPDPLPTIPGPWVIMDLLVEGIRHLQHPDGRTRQAIVTVRALIDPA